MKTFAITYIILIGCSFLIHSCNQSKHNDQKTYSTTSAVSDTFCIKFANKIHDFGNIPYKESDTLEAIFPFLNTSNSPIFINRVQGSCGCLQIEWPQTPIQPQQDAQIIVRYSGEKKGFFQKSIIVETNIPNDLTLLRIRGTLK